MQDDYSTDHKKEIPEGFCQCGCGRETIICNVSDPKNGRIRGRPNRFIAGHRRKHNLQKRFWDKVEKTTNNDCWLWIASTDEHGYGQISVNSLPIHAHRVSYEMTYGPIPRGMFVCHHCDNPPCVRPDHLFLGTPADNTHDMIAKGRNVKAGTYKKPPRRPSRMSREQIEECRLLYDTGAWYMRELADRYRMSVPSIHLVIHKRGPYK